MTLQDWLNRNMIGIPYRPYRDPFEALIREPVGLQYDLDESTSVALSRTLVEMSDAGRGVYETAMVLATYLIALHAHYRAGMAMAA